MEMTPAELREEAYNTVHIVEWDGKRLTVTEAATLFSYYFAEGASEICTELQTLIASAKAAIRKRFPDEEAEYGE